MWNDYLYIRLVEDGKKPSDSWDGWPIDPEHNNVYTHKEITDSEWNYWGVVDNGHDDLLVVDLDLYKMTADRREEISPAEKWFGLLDTTTVIRTPAINKDVPGLHIYLRYAGDELPQPIDHVDLKGSIGKGYTVSPKAPGYEIANETRPTEIDLETLKSLPVFLERTRNIETAKPKQTGIPYVDYIPDGQPPGHWPSNPAKIPETHPPCVRDAIKKYDGDSDMRLQLILKYFEAWGYNGDLVSELQEINPQIHLEDLWNCGLGTPSVYSILDRARFPENQRVEHPPFLHSTPSDTRSNFMVDDDGKTWRCWRHEITGNVYHLVAISEGIIECGDWKYDADIPWDEIMEAAVAYGIDTNFSGYCVEIKNNDLCPIDCRRYPSPFPRSND